MAVLPKARVFEDTTNQTVVCLFEHSYSFKRHSDYLQVLGKAYRVLNWP